MERDKAEAKEDEDLEKERISTMWSTAIGVRKERVGFIRRRRRNQ